MLRGSPHPAIVTIRYNRIISGSYYIRILPLLQGGVSPPKVNEQSLMLIDAHSFSYKVQAAKVPDDRVIWLS